jgi:hypothetical protein
VDAAVVHAGEIAGVVQVEIEVDVVGPDSHLNAIFCKNADSRRRAKALAQGEQRNPHEAVDVGHLAVYCNGARGRLSSGPMQAGQTSYDDRVVKLGLGESRVRMRGNG